MGQPRFVRRKIEDFAFPPDATSAEKAEAQAWLQKQKPVRVDTPPKQDVGEFVYRATQSVNPVEAVRGVRDIARDPMGAASGLASLPIDLAGQAVESWRQGDYLRAGRKAFTAALPIAGGVGGAVLGMAGGPVGIMAGGAGGYAAGSGVAAGMDEGVDQLEQGNFATGAGALVDASVQGVMGARGATRRPTPTRAEQAAVLDRGVSNASARLFGPTVGSNRYGWGNEARKLGGEMLRRTNSYSREGMTTELAELAKRTNDSLDSAYDMAPSGVRLRTDAVKRGLSQAIDDLSARDAQGNMVPLDGNVERVSALRAAWQEADRLGPTLDAKNVRKLRQSWDKLAEQVWEPQTNAGWNKVRDTGKGYADAREILNNGTRQVYPSLVPHMDDASFAIKATDLMRQLEETDSARSRVGRGIMSSLAGTVAGSMSGGLGAAIGAIAGPAVEFFLIEKAAPAMKIRSTRQMAQLADELRTNGPTSRARQLAEGLRGLATDAAASARAQNTVSSREMQPVASHSQLRIGQKVFVNGEQQLVTKVNKDDTFEAVPVKR